jgi:HEAT repeat protein
MAKIEIYQHRLRELQNWDDYLCQESGLPGPRGNLELAQAVADEGSRELFERYLTFTADKAPENTPGVFLAFCGVVGLGRLAAEGQEQYLPVLRACASDPRWRIREGVAMALQRLGDANINRLADEMEGWCEGNWLEKRAAAAALAEPRLLHNAAVARRLLDILERITAAIAGSQNRSGEDFIALKKGMAYCWSVAVAALPAEGKPAMQKWLASPDKDVRWIMKENLKKNRLAKMDAAWVSENLRQLSE